MMDGQEAARLAVVEEQVKQVRVDVCAVKEAVDALGGDVRAALNDKADKSLVESYRGEVAELRRFVVKMVVGMAVFSTTTLVGLGIYVLQLFIRLGLEGR